MKLLLIIPLFMQMAFCQTKSFKPSDYSVPPYDYMGETGNYVYGELFSKKPARVRITFYNNHGVCYSLDYAESDSVKHRVFYIYDQIVRAHEFKPEDTTGVMNEYKEQIVDALENRELNEAKWRQAVVKYKKVDKDGCIRDFTITIPKGITVPDSIEIVKYKITKIGTVDTSHGGFELHGWEFTGTDTVSRKWVKKKDIADDFISFAGYTMHELVEIAKSNKP